MILSGNANMSTLHFTRHGNVSIALKEQWELLVHYLF
jgi:hypothetical protein